MTGALKTVKGDIPLNFNKAEYFASYGNFSQIPSPDRAEIAFAGRSNVGKSTLINKVFNRKNLARVSSVPGKTATVNFYTLEDIFIVDLPGYGYAKVSESEKERWAELINGYLNDDRDLRLVFLLMDMRHPPSRDDLQMTEFLVDSQLPFVIVLTKADKLSATQRKERMDGFSREIPYFDEIRIIPFSSQTLEGIDEIRSVIEDVSSDDPETDETESEL